MELTQEFKERFTKEMWDSEQWIRKAYVNFDEFRCLAIDEGMIDEAWQAETERRQGKKDVIVLSKAERLARIRGAAAKKENAPITAERILAVQGEILSRLQEVRAAAGNPITLGDPAPAQPVKPSFEDQARHSWDVFPEVRAEFRDDFKSYLAYLKGREEGRVKIIGGKMVQA